MLRVGWNTQWPVMSVTVCAWWFFYLSGFYNVYFVSVCMLQSACVSLSVGVSVDVAPSLRVLLENGNIQISNSRLDGHQIAVCDKNVLRMAVKIHCPKEVFLQLAECWKLAVSCHLTSVRAANAVLCSSGSEVWKCRNLGSSKCFQELPAVEAKDVIISAAYSTVVSVLLIKRLSLSFLPTGIISAVYRLPCPLAWLVNPYLFFSWWTLFYMWSNEMFWLLVLRKNQVITVVMPFASVAVIFPGFLVQSWALSKMCR